MRPEHAPRLEGEMRALGGEIKRCLKKRDYARLEDFLGKYNAAVDAARSAWPLSFPAYLRKVEAEAKADPQDKMKEVMKAAGRLENFLATW